MTNQDVGIYNLLGYGEVEENGPSSYVNINFEVTLNCTVEILTPPAAYGPYTYRFHSAQYDQVIPETTSSNPTDCPVNHTLMVRN